jgi:hypothetical protein
MWVLKRTSQGGGWVAKPGSRCSYTLNLENAQKFNSSEEAVQNSCIENEKPENLENILDRFRR